MVGFIPKKDTSESVIIDILSSKSPLTVNEIHSLFKDKAMFSITYHGIYERVNSLVKKGILTRDDNKFSINPIWIKEADGFFNQIKKSYNENISLNEALGTNDVLLLRFNSLQEFDKYLKNFENTFMNNLDRNKENMICWQLKHTWWPLLYMDDELKVLRKFKKNNIKYYFVISGKAPLDEYAYNFYKKAGVFMKFYPEKNLFSFRGVYNDLLFLMIYPTKLFEKIDRLFEKTNEVGHINITEFYELIREKHNIHVMLIKNKYMTNEERDNILSIFRREIKEEIREEIFSIKKDLKQEIKNLKSAIPGGMLLDKKESYVLPVSKDEEKRVIINLNTSGCTHAKSGYPCSICGLFLNKSIKADEIFDYFISDFEKYDYSKYPTLCVYTNGSFFDSKEIPNNIRKKILKTISKEEKIKEVVFESLPKYVNDEKIKEVAKILEEKKVIVSLGLDINDEIKRTLLNKDLSISDFNSAIGILKKYSIDFCPFICVKPPFLTEGEAIETAKDTIKFVIDSGASHLSLEPVTLQKHTVQDHLNQNNLYRVSYLWTLVELVRFACDYAKDKDVKIKIGGEFFTPMPYEFAHNCKECNNRIIELIHKYNKEQDISIFKDILSLEEVRSKEKSELNCECQIDWLKAVDEKPEIQLHELPTRVKTYLNSCKEYVLK